MAHTHESSFVACIASPAATGDTDEAIIGAFDLRKHSVGEPKGGPDTGFHGCSIGEIPGDTSAQDKVVRSGGTDLTSSTSGVLGLKVSVIYFRVSCSNAPVSTLSRLRA